MSGAALAQPGLKQFFPSEGAATVSGWNVLTWLISLVKRMGGLTLSGAGSCSFVICMLNLTVQIPVWIFLIAKKKKKDWIIKELAFLYFFLALHR